VRAAARQAIVTIVANAALEVMTDRTCTTCNETYDDEREISDYPLRTLCCYCLYQLTHIGDDGTGRDTTEWKAFK